MYILTTTSCKYRGCFGDLPLFGACMHLWRQSIKTRFLCNMLLSFVDVMVCFPAKQSLLKTVFYKDSQDHKLWSTLCICTQKDSCGGLCVSLCLCGMWLCFHRVWAFEQQEVWLGIFMQNKPFSRVAAPYKDSLSSWLISALLMIKIYKVTGDFVYLFLQNLYQWNSMWNHGKHLLGFL